MIKIVLCVGWQQTKNIESSIVQIFDIISISNDMQQFF